MTSFVFDTSVFVSLESVYLLDTVLKNFQIITSPGAFGEVGDFAIHMSIFIGSRLLTKSEALQKLEQIRSIRNWQDNIIYLSAKEELNNIDN